MDKEMFQKFYDYVTIDLPLQQTLEQMEEEGALSEAGAE